MCTKWRFACVKQTETLCWSAQQSNLEAQRRPPQALSKTRQTQNWRAERRRNLKTDDWVFCDRRMCSLSKQPEGGERKKKHYFARFLLCLHGVKQVLACFCETGWEHENSTTACFYLEKILGHGRITEKLCDGGRNNFNKRTTKTCLAQ